MLSNQRSSFASTSSGSFALFADAFEEGVAKHTVRLCRTIEAADPCVEGLGPGEPRRKGWFAYPLDHCREGLLRKPVDQVRSRRIYVDHPRSDVHCIKARFG